MNGRLNYRWDVTDLEEDAGSAILEKSKNQRFMNNEESTNEGKYLDMGDKGEGGIKVPLKFWACAIWSIVDGSRRNPTFYVQRGKDWKNNPFPQPSYVHMCMFIYVYVFM